MVSMQLARSPVTVFGADDGQRHGPVKSSSHCQSLLSLVKQTILLQVWALVPAVCYPQLGGSLTPWAAPLATFPLYGLTLFTKWAAQPSQRHVRGHRAVVCGCLGLLLGPGRRWTGSLSCVRWFAPGTRWVWIFHGFCSGREQIICVSTLLSLLVVQTF